MDNGTVNFTVGDRTFTFTGEHADAMRHYQPFREPADAPEWLYRLARHLGGDGASTRRAEPLADGEVIEDGRRDSTLTSMAGTMRQRGFSESSILAALSVENETRCDPPLTDAIVRKIARSVARYEPDPLAGVTVELAPPERNGHAGAQPAAFPVPILASCLRPAEPASWLWQGYLARGTVTLFSALWKAGKTTVLAHLLRSMERGGPFCGLEVLPSRVLYVTEESEGKWAERRDCLQLQDHIRFLVRPFAAKPDWARWGEFLGYLADLQKTDPADLIVFDTLSTLWPVRDENEAPQVQAALMPLHRITEAAALLLVHHNRKGDGKEATAARGSGALAAFVDTIIELRRYDANNLKDRRRVLTGYGRYDETPAEAVVELAPDGHYVAQGERSDVSRRDIVSTLFGVLPGRPPGLTAKEVEDDWPERTAPRHKSLLDALNHGAETGVWARDGEGVRGDPYRFWKPPS